jgi:hypothetical protein
MIGFLNDTASSVYVDKNYITHLDRYSWSGRTSGSGSSGDSPGEADDQDSDVR